VSAFFKNLKKLLPKGGKKAKTKSSLIYDEDLLQYSKPGQEGECELVIGLDFGTSASKVVIQAPDLPGSPSFAVDFCDFAHPSMAYLLPTKLCVMPSGECHLNHQEGGLDIGDIKLELFVS